MPAPDVVVIGGGIIGLSVADHLVARGARVVVLERRTWGAGASGAAAGMLAPLAEVSSHSHVPEGRSGAFLSLALAGLEAHGPWLERLRAETGLEVGPHGPGMLRVAGDGEAEALRAAFERQQGLDLPLEWLTGAEALSLEPNLAPCEAAVLSPREQHVQPPLLVQALAQSLRTRGADLREGAPVRGFTTRRGRVLTARLDTGEVPGGEFVLAGGAWSPEIAAALDASVSVEPIRGQILSLTPTPLPFRHTIYTRAGYLVPKPDGRLVVGATEEQAGFAAHPTAAGVARLLAMAARLAPCLAEAPFSSAWAGLRPAAPDRLPLLGPLPGWENVALATGHFRNGILLAPLTGSLLAEWVLCRHVAPLMAPFLPSRS